MDWWIKYTALEKIEFLWFCSFQAYVWGKWISSICTLICKKMNESETPKSHASSAFWFVRKHDKAISADWFLSRIAFYGPKICSLGFLPIPKCSLNQWQNGHGDNGSHGRSQGTGRWPMHKQKNEFLITIGTLFLITVSDLTYYLTKPHKCSICNKYTSFSLYHTYCGLLRLKKWLL